MFAKILNLSLFNNKLW